MLFRSSPKIFSGDVKFDSTNIGELKIQNVLKNKHFNPTNTDEKLDVNKTKLVGSDTINLENNALSLKISGLNGILTNTHFKSTTKAGEKLDVNKTKLAFSDDFEWLDSGTDKFGIKSNIFVRKADASTIMQGKMSMKGLDIENDTDDTELNIYNNVKDRGVKIKIGRAHV